MSKSDKIDKKVQEWMQFHTKKDLAQIQVNNQATIAVLTQDRLKARRALALASEEVNKQKWIVASNAKFVLGLQEQISALESDCQDLLNDLNKERNNVKVYTPEPPLFDPYALDQFKPRRNKAPWWEAKPFTWDSPGKNTPEENEKDKEEKQKKEDALF